MHIKLFLVSAKPKAVQEAQKLHCIDAAASDAKILSKWCLASLVYIFWNLLYMDIFWEFMFQNLWNDSARRVQYVSHFLLTYWTIE